MPISCLFFLFGAECISCQSMPSSVRTMARMPSRSGAGNMLHRSTTTAASGSILLRDAKISAKLSGVEFATLECCGASAFPASVSKTSARRGQRGPKWPAGGFGRSGQGAKGRHARPGGEHATAKKGTKPSITSPSGLLFRQVGLVAAVGAGEYECPVAAADPLVEKQSSIPRF